MAGREQSRSCREENLEKAFDGLGFHFKLTANITTASMKKLLVGFASAGFFLANAGAALLFYDGFDYAPPGTPLAPVTDTTASPNPGFLNTASGWNWRYAGAGGTANQATGIASVGLSYNNVAGYSGLQATVGNSALFDTTQIGSARIQAMPTAISSGTVYYSALLQVGSIGSLTTGANGMLLGGLVTSGDAGTLPGTVGGVLRIRQDTSDPSVYHIGVGMNSGTATGAGGANVQFANSLNFSAGQTVFVVASYEFVTGANNDIARMWINPNLADFGAGSPPIATLTAAPGVAVADSSANVLAFNLRNVNTVGTPTGVLFDELRVGTAWADVMPSPVPEPAAAGLMGIGLLMAAGCYRLRKR
jgi:hypothetical protein